MDYSGNNFGPYAISFTTKNDVAEVIALIQDKEILEPSKRDAVYERKRTILETGISNGLFTKIERVAADQEEQAAFGGSQRRIIGITGGYMLGMDSGGTPQPMSTETTRNRQHIQALVSEVGTSLVIHKNDLRNSSGLLPSRCFYKLLIAATSLNLFRLVGREVGNQKLQFDTITANVQNHSEMRMIMNWLTSPPLSWGMIEMPSTELIKATSSTTEDADNFESRSKFFYELSPSSTPNAAEYLLGCIKDEAVTSDHEFNKKKAHIKFEFDKEMIDFIQAIAAHKEFLSKHPSTSFSELRRLVPMVAPTRTPPVDRKIHSRRASDGARCAA